MLRPRSRPASPRLAAAALLTAACALTCAPPNAAIPYPKEEPPLGEARPPRALRAFDRALALEPILAGFPYGDVQGSLVHDRLFFLERGERSTLRSLLLADAGAPVDLSQAPAVSDVDWSTRALGELVQPRGSKALWLLAAAEGDARRNLWTLDLASGALTQVTDVDHVLGFGLADDDATIAYLAHSSARPPDRTCLRLRTLATGEEREVLCDGPSLLFTRSSPRFGPGGREVYFNALGGGDRRREQLVAVDLTAARPSARVVTDAGAPRSVLYALRGAVDDAILYVADDDGFANLYAHAPRTRETRQLTRLREGITSARLIAAGVVAVQQSAAGSALIVVDPRTGKVLGQQRLAGAAAVIDADDERVLWARQAPDLPLEVNLARITRAADGGAPGLHNQRLVAPDPARLEAMIHCEVEAVRIPTHDTDPATGRRRELHANVLRPRAPQADARRRLAVIQAFGGGEGVYSPFDQVMCAAGVTVISPSVRGGDGFGRAFAALNDRDLGGAEIVDLFEVGRWAQATLGLEPRQIGVFGDGHGGYAALRALTYPDAPERFPFGFGLAHAAFTDLPGLTQATRAPEWLLQEAGDPADPRDLARLRERSPLAHVERLQAPLLLSHGDRDARVPVDQARRFAARAKELGKPVTYVELAGQGHNIEGLARQVELARARFELLEAVAGGGAQEAQ